METMQMTQIERLGEKLSTLKADVTTKDRTAASTELKLSKETISRYLNNRIDVMDADTAVSLIKFFEGKIKGREKFLG